MKSELEVWDAAVEQYNALSEPLPSPFNYYASGALFGLREARTLTAEQWEELQYTVARVVWAERAKGTVHPNYRFNALADPVQRGLLAEADAALTALGFRRAEEGS